MDNPCLRPACLSDVTFEWIHRPYQPQWGEGIEYNAAQHGALKKLYDAEWRQRGFERSP